MADKGSVGVQAETGVLLPPPVDAPGAPLCAEGSGSARAAFAGAVCRVLAAVERVPKRGWNAAFNYAFVREGDVLDAVRDACAREGLALIPSVESVDRLDTERKTRAGATIWRVTVHLRMTVIERTQGHAETLTWCGEADDDSDKGVAKAITAGTKYLLKTLFLVPTGGEDPDEAPGAKGAKGSGPTDGITRAQEALGPLWDAWKRSAQVLKVRWTDIAKEATGDATSKGLCVALLHVAGKEATKGAIAHAVKTLAAGDADAEQAVHAAARGRSEAEVWVAALGCETVSACVAALGPRA